MPIKVLVADDSPTIRRRAAATLSEAGYEVTCVESGEAAWALLESGDSCQVLLCDILMPGMDGYDLCQRVKAAPALAHLPVLLLRGTFEPWDQAKAENVGADGFITKPFDANVLLSTLAEVVAELVPGAGVQATPVAAPQPAASRQPAAASPPAASEPAPPEPQPSPLPVAPADPGPLGGASASPLGEPLPAAAASAVLEDPFGLGDETPSAPTPAMPPAAAALPPTTPVRVAPVASPAGGGSGSDFGGGLDDAALDRLAARVVARLSAQQVEKIAWEVVPDVAEALIRKRLLEIESKLSAE